MLSGQRLAVDRIAAVSANIQADQFSRGVMGSTAVFGTACFGSSPDGRARRAPMNIIGMRDNGMRRNAPSLKHWLA